MQKLEGIFKSQALPDVVKHHRKAAPRKEVKTGKLVDEGRVGAGLQLVVVKEAARNLKEALVRPKKLEDCKGRLGRGNSSDREHAS